MYVSNNICLYEHEHEHEQQPEHWLGHEDIIDPERNVLGTNSIRLPCHSIDKLIIML